jgi:hypothetical protein
VALTGCGRVDLTADSCALQAEVDPCQEEDCQSSRSFQLASTGIQATPNFDDEPFYSFAASDLAVDVDVVAIHEDFYGIPWDEFLAGEDPPRAWVEVMDGLVEAVADKPVFLSLQLVGGSNRAFLGARTQVLDDETLGSSEAEWSDLCYDFDAAEDADEIIEGFVAYAEWMIDRFDPVWLNPAIEMNLFYQACPDQWDALVRAEGEIHDAIKASHSDLVVFPSFVLETLYGLDPDCTDSAEDCLEDVADEYEENYAALAEVKRDRFAISTYPFGYTSMARVEDVPEGWFTGPSELGSEQLIIAETGWNSAPVNVKSITCGGCEVWREFGCQEQADYFSRVVAEADVHDIELVTWWSSRDLLPSGVSGTCRYSGLPREWRAPLRVFRKYLGCYLGEIVFKLWGTMGIRTYDGDPKGPIFPLWEAARTRPFSDGGDDTGR